MSQTTSPEQLQVEMQQAIENAERALEQGFRFFEEQGLDREKAEAFLAAQFGEEGSVEARQAFEADMRAVEQEVREEMARRESNSGTPAPVRRPRPMV